MEKTKEFVKAEYEKYDSLYWESLARLEKKRKEFDILRNEIIYLTEDVDKYFSEYKRFEEMLNELNIGGLTEINE